MKVDYNRHTAGRLFDNAFLEASSKVYPVTPFAFYVPIIGALALWGLTTGRTTVGWFALFAPVGWLTWCAMEYGLHRGFFHWEGSGPFTRKVHAIIHGYHHEFPDDPLRAVMPLGASIPLAMVIGALLYLVNVPAATIPFFAGLVSGYLFYDFMHWAIHHRQPRTAWGKTMRSHHLAHHFACPDKNFGISHRWVDAIAGSLRRRPESKAEAKG